LSKMKIKILQSLGFILSFKHIRIHAVILLVLNLKI
jgi:hypothetical protein